MKIYSINKPSFQYNSAYHQEVKEKLNSTKTNKNMAQMLIAADEFSLQIEDRLIELEKDSRTRKTDAFYDMGEFLSLIKENISVFFDFHFPKLNYTKEVAKQYRSEIENETDTHKAHWRRRIADKIDPPTIAQKPKQTSQTEAEKDETQKTIKEVQEQAIDEFMAKIEKSILEEFHPTESSPKGFSDVVGMEEIKERFQEDLINYIMHPELKELDEKEYGIKAPRGFLFYGPPGCGKTFITQALAMETGLAMYKMDVSKAGSRYVNQTANNLQTAFDGLAKKVEKTGKQCILFMDEVDALAIKRSEDSYSSDENLKTTTTLLKLVEQARDKGIIVIAATNRYDMLDDAFKARFDGQIYFGLPDEQQIEALIKASLSKRTKGQKLAQNKEEIEQLVKELKGHSNRSIVFIIDEAAKIARRKERKEISIEDVKEAIEKSELEKLKETNYQKKSKTKRKLGFG